MIDFHTHILPYIDDGSRSDEMTFQMIEESKKQGVDCIIATPHFYPNVDDIESFIQKRDRAYSRIEDKLDIKMLKGAEVQYFSGISKVEEVKRLCIEGTNVLLVEMPFNRKFDNSMISDIIELSHRYRVVIAHFERYLDNNPVELFENLCRYGIVLQVNANSFTKFLLRIKLLKLLKKGLIGVVASDMHNITSRPQNLEEAFKIIKKSCGKKTAEKIVNDTDYLIYGEA